MCVVEVSWSDGRRTYVKRTYEDFLNFQNSVISELKEESSDWKWSKHVDIPRLKGKGLFQRNSRRLAEVREFELHAFVGELLSASEQICALPVVVDFFESRKTDPCPMRTSPLVIQEVSMDSYNSDSNENS
ncbi:hypothetical protein ScPMuIL_000139 [Solemya velum]